MLEQQDDTFKSYVQGILEQQKGARIYQFDYHNQLFWLKQPEKLTGVDRLLKPNPQKRFQQECQTLLALQQKNAPIPRLCLWGDDFLVLEDAGKSVNLWIEDPELSLEQKNAILQDCAQGIIALHQQNLVHGRPAIRDLLWKNGQVKFVDFESHSHINSLAWQKIRDILVFIHSLCRTELISDAQIQQIVQYFATHGDKNSWQQVLKFVHKARWLYYMLFPFKPIAKTDLIAIYRLFDILNQENNR